MVLEQVLSDLEREGYKAFPPFISPACGLNAPHRRNRATGFPVLPTSALHGAGTGTRSRGETVQVDGDLTHGYVSSNLTWPDQVALPRVLATRRNLT